MNSQELSAETAEVEATIKEYATSLQAMDNKAAAEAGERLVDMECGVCTSIGQHLTGLAVAVTTAPDPGVRESIRSDAIRSAEGILADLRS